MKFHNVKASLTRQRVKHSIGKHKRDDTKEFDSSSEDEAEDGVGSGDEGSLESGSDFPDNEESDLDDSEYGGGDATQHCGDGAFFAASFANLESPAAALRDMLSPVPCMPSSSARLGKSVPQVSRGATHHVMTDKDWTM